MRSNYKRIGDCIQLVDERNANLQVKTLLGISISKEYIPSVANIVGTDMENYKIIRRNQFACSTMQVRRDRKMPVALLANIDEAIISAAYPVFEVVDTELILPEYLMMWFRRTEFDREACFYAIGGVRGSIEWEDFCNMQLPVPSITKQKEIVTEYNVLVDRINLNKRLIQKLEETAQAIYKQWFIDFEFPDKDGKPYKSNGGEILFNKEFDKAIPKGWEVKTLGDACKVCDNLRKPLSELERRDMKGIYPYYGAMSIVDYINKYLFDGIYLLFSEDGVNVIDEKGHPSLQYIWGKFWVNNHAHIINGNEIISTEFLYLFLKNVNVSHLVTGAAQPKINQENMNSISVLIPDEFILIQFNKLVSKIFIHFRNVSENNLYISTLREILLSKLATMEDNL